MKQLYNKLQYIDHSKENRSRLSKEVLNNQTLLPDLMEICLINDDKTSIKAYWVLEYSCKNSIEIIIPFLDDFIENLHKVNFDSSKRPVAKICELICEFYSKNELTPIKKVLTNVHINKISEACFDWLISNEKVAVKAHAMRSLFLLGKKFDWIHPELKQVLEQGFSTHTAAYKARARHILNKLK
jgi:hypothetical protein